MKECPTCGACLEDEEERCPENESVLQSSLIGPPLIDGRLRLERRIGSGGMGVVYRAHHTGLAKTVAVKLIRPRAVRDTAVLHRFENEAMALGRLDHPNIVRVTDYGIEPREGGIPYLVMEYVEGAKLSTLLHASSIGIDEALVILDLIARSVDFAHERGVLHRDLKPDNVMVRVRAGEAPDVRVLDFGLARLFEKSLSDADAAHLDCAPAAEKGAPARGPLSTAGVLVGTPGYMAPDVVRGLVGRAADIYSFGLIAYELLTGRPPFTGSPDELIEQHLEATPPAPSITNGRLPSAIDGPILEALDKDPDRRPRTAGALVAGLRDANRSALVAAWKKRELPRRIAISACLTALLLFLAHGAADAPPLRSLDDKFADACVYLAPPRPLSSRIRMLRLPDEFWDHATDASRLAAVIDRLYEGGARGVAVDLILPERFGKDPELATAILRHEASLVLSAAPTGDGRSKGTEVAVGFVTAALGEERAAQLFGIVSIEEDQDGVVRRYPLCTREVHGTVRPSLASRAVHILSGQEAPADCPDIGIDFSADWRQNAMNLDEAMTIAERDGDLFRDRMILLSGTSTLGEDIHRVPHPRSMDGWVSGVVIHALAMETVLQGSVITRAGALPVLFVVALEVMVLAFSCLWSRRSVAPLSALPALVLAHAACFAALFLKWHVLIPVALPLFCLLAITTISVPIRRRLPPHPSNAI
ncbi:MAG: protein kinase [Acidobacteria bacterium]|nr:protein kinase [Acidobacteriota bacterium]